MFRPPAVAARRRDAHTPRLPIVAGALALAALATMTAGVVALYYHARLAESQQTLAPAGIVLLACSFVQWRTAWRLWNQQARFEGVAQSGAAFLRRLAVGVFLVYAAAIAFGSLPYVEVAFGTGVVAWATLLLVPLAATRHLRERWLRWTHKPIVRRLGRVVFVSVLVVIAAEGGLRAFKVARELGWLASGAQIAPREQILLPPVGRDGQGIAGATPRLTPGPFRVAVLIDAPAAQASERSRFLLRLEQSLPGVKIIPLSLGESWASQPTANISAELAAAQPDLVLATLSICEDLTRVAEQPGWFDWRQCELAQLVSGGAPQSNAALRPHVTGDNFESFLAALTPQLAACRTPIDERMRSRWQRTLAALDNLLSDCKASDLNVALVLVPGEFQVNRALCDTLARRAGYKSEQVDVELPQRKLLSFAEGRQVPLIDLLPALRLCGESPYERNTAAWNDAGHEAAAAAIGGWLASKYGPELAVAAQLTSAP